MAQVYAPSSVLKGVRALLLQAIAMSPKSYLGRIAMLQRSETDDEDYAWLGEPPRMRQLTEDDALVYDGMSDANFTLTNQIWAAGLALRRKDFDDQQSSVITHRIQQLAQVGVNHVNRMIVQALVTNANGYDGGALFSTHAARGAQTATQANTASGSGTTTAQIQADLADALEGMMAFLAENNEPFSEEITKVTVVYPPQIDRQMREATKSVLISNTSNVLSDSFQWDLIPTPRLTDVNDYYVINASNPTAMPVILQERDALEVTSKTDGDDAFDAEIYKYKIRWRGVAGPGHWQAGYRITN